MESVSTDGSSSDLDIIPSKERRHPLAKCEDCPLNTPAFGYVPSFGPDLAVTALVGQNPGRNEIKRGRPFIGPSGRLLDKVLTAFHLNREEMFITNACLCTSKDNPTFSPPPAAIQACRPRLIAELRQHRVESVMALGGTATQSILRTKTGVTQLRVGPYRETDDLPGARIIPTFHPAACLRSSASFPSMANDFQKLVTSVPPWQEPKVVVLNSVCGALFAIKVLRTKYRRAVVDIETDLDKEKSYDHANNFGLLCIGICVQKGIGIVFSEEACKSSQVLDELADWLKDCELIFQNGKFDIGGLYPKGFKQLRIGRDTMLQSYALDERSGIHGLKYNAVEKLGAPRYDEDLDQYTGTGKNKRFGNIPRPILYTYNGYDVTCTLDLDEFFTAEMQREDALHLEPVRPRADGEWWGLERLHKFLCEAATNFMFLELNGFAVDLSYNRELQKEYKAEIAGYEEEMFRVVGRRDFNPRSPMQVKAELHKLEITVPKKKNSKGELAETTDAESLQLMLDAIKFRRTNTRSRPMTLQAKVVKGGSNEIGPEVVEISTEDRALTFLENLLKHRKASKMDGTYVSGLRKYVYRGRVYPTIMIHSTDTGRLSQRKPSLQVIPRGDKLRRQYKVAKDDHVLIECDYAQLELRVLTWLAQEEYFRAIFNDSSRDLFSELEPVIKPERSFREQLSKKDRRNVVKCAPLSTQMLTRRGWKHHNELIVGEEVLGYHDSKLVWTKLRQVNYMGKQPIGELTGKGFRAVTTADHRWVTRDWRPGCGGWRDNGERASAAIGRLKSIDRVVLSAPYVGGSSTLSADEAAILSWLLTDGCISINSSQVQATIQQSKPQGIATIDELLKNVPHRKRYKAPKPLDTLLAGIPHRKITPGRLSKEGYEWRLATAYVRELCKRAGLALAAPFKQQDFTQLILELSAEALQAFCNAADLAEGGDSGYGYTTKSGDEKVSRRIWQHHGPVEEALRLAFFLLGERPTIVKDQELAGPSFGRGNPNKVFRELQWQELGEEEVWCPTTDADTWVMRQHNEGAGDTIALSRQCFVYGLAYGREAKSIAEEFDIPLRDAQSMYRDFFGVIPNIVAFRENTKRKALRGEDLVTPFGRRRRFNLITDENTTEIQNSACAFYPQSIGSDICVQAFNWLRPELKGIAWCRNTVHDALYWETHQDNVEHVARLVQQRMEESARAVCGDYVAFKAEPDVGRDWGTMISLDKWLAGERPYPVAVELWKPERNLIIP